MPETASVTFPDFNKRSRKAIRSAVVRDSTVSKEPDPPAETGAHQKTAFSIPDDQR